MQSIIIYTHFTFNFRLNYQFNGENKNNFLHCYVLIILDYTLLFYDFDFKSKFPLLFCRINNSLIKITLLIDCIIYNRYDFE